jgi:flagellar L-ring protein FlgH
MENKMNKIYLFFLINILGFGFLYSQNMRDNVERSLFSDHKATQVGDAVTILIAEESNASNSAETSTSRESKVNASGTAGFNNQTVPPISGTIGHGSSFSGNGSTTNKGVIKDKISAKIVSIDENGNLKIEGSRKRVINKEEQTIQISGSIRPQDILPDNSIYSYKICDAEIMIKGDGIVSSANGPGWITKLISWLF